jgi:hypothetical protein
VSSVLNFFSILGIEAVSPDLSILEI